MDPPEPSGLFGERDRGEGYIHVVVETHIYRMTRVDNLDPRKARDHLPHRGASQPHHAKSEVSWGQEQNVK